MFNDPRKGNGIGVPEVIVTRVVNMNKPELGEGAEAEVGEEEQSLPSTGEALGKPAKEEVIEILEFLCPECGRKCKTSWGLRVHQRVHKKGTKTI